MHSLKFLIWNKSFFKYFVNTGEQKDKKCVYVCVCV